MQAIEFESVLKSFGIDASCLSVDVNKNVHSFNLKLDPGTRIKKIESCLDELSLHVRSFGKPSLKVVPEKGIVQIDFISKLQEKVNVSQIIGNRNPNHIIPCVLGYSYDGMPISFDLTKNPHMLIAGSTNSGKSVLLHNIIFNISNLENVNMFLIDTKNVEFSIYEDLERGKRKNKNVPAAAKRTVVATDYKAALQLFEWLYDIMESRFKEMVKLNMKNNNSSYFQNIVVVVDEFADLIFQDKDNKLERKLASLAQKARAAGIYLIMATQRPSVDIFKGYIKANFPARIACKVSSSLNSRVIIDRNGAENLNGNGDAYISNYTYDFVRFQTAYCDYNIYKNYYGC